MNLSRIRTAYIDFDGTLLDSEGCWVAAYLLACEKKSIAPSPHIVDAFKELNFADWETLIEKQLGADEKFLLECAKIVYAKRSPRESVLSILRSLSTDCVKSVITREPSELVWHWLACNGIMDFKNVITLGDERKNSSCYALSSLLLVDDNYRHCVAAKSANAVVIGVNDHHTVERKAQMREICDCYLES